MNAYGKEIGKISQAISDLISKIELDQAELQVEQDDYESELQDYDPEEEGSIAPEDPGKENEIVEMDNLLEELSSAQDIIDNI